MAKVTVGLPQGTRDFGPETVRKRNYIFNTIKNVFELYGFQPLETPAMENMETLMGKYGDEGDKLIFKILNNGLTDAKNIEKAKAAFENVLQGKNSKDLTERALKYDLTIPFARYVAMNHSQLNFPFKRYQIQPVWRADRPQKGRYREFYQCDADVAGSNSLLNETELANIYATVFDKLGIAVEIKINSRKILTALAEVCGGADKLMDITIAIDKLDKIGLEKVKEELSQRGLNVEQIIIIEKYLGIIGSNEEKIAEIKSLLGDNETGKKGMEEIEYIISSPLPAHYSLISIDFTLARGLNYYTGIIFEVKAIGVQMGSIGGGGRYDDLTGLFGVPNIPGVGISFGVDRIYDVMEELQLFPSDVHIGTQVLFFNLGEMESKKAFELAQQLRNQGIRTELYHENSKFDKQFKYAEKKNIPYIIIMGSKELEEKTCVIKNLGSGEQQSLPVGDLVNFAFI
jgi:histidyl-tRNA synthetase